MKTLNQILVATVCALPLIAAAQTTMSPNVKPADQPRSALEKEQTTDNGQATKYGAPGTDTGGTTKGTSGMTGSSMSSGKSGMKHDKGMKHDSTGTATKAGDVPTYPAPAKDGTPTK